MRAGPRHPGRRAPQDRPRPRLTLTLRRKAVVTVGRTHFADDDAVSVVPAMNLALGLAVLREAGKLCDGPLVGEVVDGIDDITFRRLPLLDPLEAGKAAGELVDL